MLALSLQLLYSKTHNGASLNLHLIVLHVLTVGITLGHFSVLAPRTIIIIVKVLIKLLR